jgi:hypothetical protein
LTFESRLGARRNIEESWDYKCTMKEAWEANVMGLRDICHLKFQWETGEKIDLELVCKMPDGEVIKKENSQIFLGF